jgi:hypothetical protein
MKCKIPMTKTSWNSRCAKSCCCCSPSTTTHLTRAIDACFVSCLCPSYLTTPFARWLTKDSLFQLPTFLLRLPTARSSPVASSPSPAVSSPWLVVSFPWLGVFLLCRVVSFPLLPGVAFPWPFSFSPFLPLLPLPASKPCVHLVFGVVILDQKRRPRHAAAHVSPAPRQTRYSIVLCDSIPNGCWWSALAAGADCCSAAVADYHNGVLVVPLLERPVDVVHHLLPLLLQ